MNLRNRLTWHAARTPIVHVIKALKRASLGGETRERRRLAGSMAGDPGTALLAEQLNRDGYVDVSDILRGPALAAIQAAADAKLSRVGEAKAAQISSHKAFWVRLLDEEMTGGLLSTDNPFVAIALEQSVIGVIAAALGELPQLDYVLLTLSEGSNAPLTSSQLWHRDYDDVRTIKLFVYLTDVQDREKGPFTFLPGPVSDKVGFTRRTHRTDEMVFAGHVRREEVKEMTGPRGSAFIVETSRCLHMGSRIPPGNTRLLYTATFTTAPSIYSGQPPAFALTGREDNVTKTILSSRSVPVEMAPS